MKLIEFELEIYPGRIEHGAGTERMHHLVLQVRDPQVVVFFCSNVQMRRISIENYDFSFIKADRK